MGIYTSFKLDTNLEHNEIIFRILDFMIYNDISEVKELDFIVPDHKLFKTSRWLWMLHQSDEGLYKGDSFIEDNDRFYHLRVRSSFKCYENEINKFLDWLAPSIISTGSIGEMIMNGCSGKYIYKISIDTNKKIELTYKGKYF